MHGQFYLVHLSADGDVFQDKAFAADDGLHKFLGSHWETFFHDSLLDCARKSSVLRRDMVDFGIPLFANIHLCGSVLTEVFFCMTVSKVLYGSLPSFGTMVVFCLLLGVFAIGAPGVPGGTVMASLGLISGVLGFGEDGLALMLAIFALQDSFGTACNVTGDGALTLMLTGYAEKHHVGEQRLSVDL